MWGFISRPPVPFHWFYMSVFTPVPLSLDYWNFVVNFESGSMSPPTLFFSRLFQLFWVPWISIWTLRSACQFLQRSQLVLWEWLPWNMQINLRSIAILSKLSLPIYEHGISFHLFRYPFLSLSFFFLATLCSIQGILVPWPGIEPMPLAVEVQSLNHWTAREVSI